MTDPRSLVAFSCPNQPGIVAAVTGALSAAGGNILEAHQFDDVITGRFFMRMVFEASQDQGQVFAERFACLAAHYAMEWQHRALTQRARVLLLVSRFDHCLADLLYRWRIGELAVDIVGIVSNHDRATFAHIDVGAVPFHYLPVTAATRAAQEGEIKRIVAESRTDLIVLARYMQVLSDDLAGFLAGRCINIHHSFLPGFKGAKPYHQAHARGVKLIGATAHYVTADLDEGPIIEQDVERIGHHEQPEDLVRKGRDIERRVLARAVALHVAGRVFASGGKTVVFRD